MQHFCTDMAGFVRREKVVGSRVPSLTSHRAARLDAKRYDGNEVSMVVAKLKDWGFYVF